MHPKFNGAHEWSSKVIGAAIEAHREMGPGLLESIYEGRLACEFGIRSIPHVRQLQIPIQYKGWTAHEPLRSDFVVDGCLVVEAKAVESVLPVHKARVLTYMKLLDAPLGLLVDFSEPVLKTGVVRLIPKGADA